MRADHHELPTPRTTLRTGERRAGSCHMIHGLSGPNVCVPARCERAGVPVVSPLNRLLCRRLLLLEATQSRAAHQAAVRAELSGPIMALRKLSHPVCVPSSLLNDVGRRRLFPFRLRLVFGFRRQRGE